MEQIIIKNLSKSYGTLTVLKNVDLTLDRYKTYCLMSPSGTGKTTLFRILMGLERADSGRIDGLNGLRISAVFQEDRLCEDCSAVKNLEMILGDASQARTALTQLLPEEALDQPCHELSGGMKRRVSLVRAMEAGAQCVLLDEPFTGLDEENRKKAEDYIRRKTRGRIVMIATHIRTGEEFSEMTQMQI